MPLSCDLRPRSTDLRHHNPPNIPNLPTQKYPAAFKQYESSKFQVIKGLGLLLCILACVPAIVRAGPRPAPMPQGGSRCLEATAKIVGVSGITGTASFRQPRLSLVKVTVDGLQTRENDFFIGKLRATVIVLKPVIISNPSIGAIFPCPNNGADQSKCQVGFVGLQDKEAVINLQRILLLLKRDFLSSSFPLVSQASCLFSATLMASWAFVTLLTSDSYLPGALVTASSIKESEKELTRKYDLVCLVTLDSVSVQSIKALRQVYDLVISVEEIRSGHAEHELKLLGRQDLSSTMTKIHIWRLTQYEKVIYLDSDTLLLKSISHLFELAPPFSACADIGWPDCFNSGLMVISPSNETFGKIFQHFLSHGSWDGGDQGLLNDYFAQSSGEMSPTGSEGQSSGWNRLSFVYNVTPSAYYTYAPAYKRYGDKISMIHFIGSDKPWHLINRRRYKNAYAPNQQSDSLNAIDYDSLVDRWLDVYEKAVGPIEPVEWTFLQPEFNFPKYASEWDSAQPSAYQPPTLDELKETFSRRQASISSQSYNLNASNKEGGYMTLPFLDLSRMARDYILSKQSQDTAASRSTQDSNYGSSDLNQPQGTRDHQVWDPSTSAPPTSGGYQMNQPITKHYEAVWDKSFREQSASFSSRHPSII
ncbi:hypothetical protein H4Q26_005078 [Puccinia striiformis f. sp. tritici PST-130]|nr:hypothetical protein H4Q26_005078 [Puccinia striiformis f. sp. tritici PST-130]